MRSPSALLCLYRSNLAGLVIGNRTPSLLSLAAFCAHPPPACRHCDLARKLKPNPTLPPSSILYPHPLVPSDRPISPYRPYPRPSGQISLHKDEGASLPTAQVMRCQLQTAPLPKCRTGVTMSPVYRSCLARQPPASKLSSVNITTRADQINKQTKTSSLATKFRTKREENKTNSHGLGTGAPSVYQGRQGEATQHLHYPQSCCRNRSAQEGSLISVLRFAPSRFSPPAFAHVFVESARSHDKTLSRKSSPTLPVSLGLFSLPLSCVCNGIFHYVFFLGLPSSCNREPFEGASSYFVRRLFELSTTTRPALPRSWASPKAIFSTSSAARTIRTGTRLAILRCLMRGVLCPWPFSRRWARLRGTASSLMVAAHRLQTRTQTMILAMAKFTHPAAHLRLPHLSACPSLLASKVPWFTVW